MIFDQADQPLSICHPASYTLQEVMHNIGQKFEQDFVTDSSADNPL